MSKELALGRSAENESDLNISDKASLAGEIQ